MEKIILFIKSKKIFLKFCSVGMLNTIISFATYSILILLGTNYLKANITAYIIGMINSYIWNRNWVFRDKGSRVKSFIKFICLNVSMMLFSTSILFILVHYVSVNKIVSQVITTSIIMVINYIGNKSIVFRK